MKKSIKMIMGFAVLVLIVLSGLYLTGTVEAADLLAGGAAVPLMFGTTLAANAYRIKVIGNVNEFAVIASDIIYESAAVGLVDASGHARPLTSADKFVGFAESKADNSTGSAAGINVRVLARGVVKLAVTGAVITDIGQPVYATDDNAFQFSPVSAVYIGKIIRFVSSGVVEVQFDAVNNVDPYEGYVRELVSDDLTLNIEDNGKALFVDTDAKTITLLTYAAATALDVLIVNLGAFGTVAVAVDPAAGDKTAGPNDTGADGGIATNTKATARRGDCIHLQSGGDDGYIVKKMKGIWTIA